MGESKETDKEEIIKKLNNLQREVASLKKESLISSEDQLFFGFVITLAFFVITFSISDMASFFQSFLKLDAAYAANLSELLRNVLITFIFSSAIMRYYASIKPHKNGKAFFISFSLVRIMHLDSPDYSKCCDVIAF